MEQVFSSGALSPEEGFRRYREITQREFYDGELMVEEGGAPFDIHVEKVLTAPVSILHVTSRSVMSYHRTSRHIRGNRGGFRVIWIVGSGSLKIVRSHGECEITAGQAAILDSDHPFRATHAPDGEQPYEAFQVIIPPDIFFRHLSEAERFVAPFHLDGPHGAVARHLLQLVVAHGDHLWPKTSHSLGLAVLDAIADHLSACKFEMPQRRTITDQRLAEIENFIMMHLTDPDICYEKVAASCGISSRYLSYLLKANNTSFSDLLWQNRLPKARDWLVSAKTRHFSIHEIAHMCGFKSASHFSRKFKKAYGCSPRAFRSLNCGEE